MASRPNRAKSRGRFFGMLWRAIVWSARGAFSLLSWLARHLAAAGVWLLYYIINAGGRLAGRAAVAARAQAVQSSRSHTGASDLPLVCQKQISGDLGAFEKRLYSDRSTIGLILGARGSGKSAIGMRLLENASARTGRPVCAIGFDASSLPAWIRCVADVEEVPNGSFVLVDEGGVLFSSRSSMSSANKVLSSLLLVARHKDLSVMFISQNSANLELNAIRQADYLLMRKPSMLQQEFERKKIGEIYAGIGTRFAALPQAGRYSTYIYSDEFRGFVLNELPSFWSARASKSFAGFKSPGRGA